MQRALRLFEDHPVGSPLPIVNVASVPQRSPFRYPGGKTWLVPRLRQWLASRPQRPRLFAEPFAGGGIIALTVACERLADKVLMVELDDDVAAVWQTILNGKAMWLAQRIIEFDLTAESVQDELARPACSIEERAFHTILRNRINRGGILAPGVGILKNGENGKGLRSRWYPQTLKRRIEDISAVSDRIEFIHGDGIRTLREYANRADAAFFIDPPYTAGGKRAGSRLYTHSEIDHEDLFCITASLKGDYLMTYDNADDVRALAERHGLDTELVAMKSTHHAAMTELLIGRDLSWARNPP